MSLPPSAQRVQDALLALGVQSTVITLPDSTRTAVEAAAAVGCTVGAIVKSLVFRAALSNTPIFVAASGSNRVDEQLLAALVGEPIAKADAAFVREHTGFAIGGVAPVGHPSPLRSFIDRGLLQYETIWAAAGTPKSVFAITPAELMRITGGEVVTVSAATST